MGLTDLSPEVKSMIVKFTPGRQDLLAWRGTCSDTRAVLLRYCKNLEAIFKHQHKFEGLTQPEVSTSSPEIFLAWMRVKPRTDDAIMRQSHKLFYKYKYEYDGESRDEEVVRKKNARLVLNHIRDHIGDDRFTRFLENSVQDDSAWGMDVVSALSKDDDQDDEDDSKDNDHEFALHLERAALETLKTHRRRLHEDDNHLSDIKDEINTWALEHEGNLEKTKAKTLAIVRFDKLMLDYWLAHENPRDELIPAWASIWFKASWDFFIRSNVRPGDEGQLADSMLETIKKNPDCPFVQEWADRCFNQYASFGMPVHAIKFAQGMLEIALPYGSDTAELSSKWKQRCLDKKREQALWKKAGDLAQVMLRAYLECESFRGSLPAFLQITQEKQLKNVACGSQKPQFRLLKHVGPGVCVIAFPEELPRRLLNDIQAQAQILKSVNRATHDANGTPIHNKNMVRELQSAIKSWETGNSDDTIGVYQPRESTNRTSDV
jgi:hypothetical protein